MTNKRYIWTAYAGLLRLLQLAIDAMLPSAEFNEKAMQLALDLRYTTTSNAEIVAKALHSLGAGLIDEMEAADRDHRAKQVAAFRQQIHLARDNSRHALRLRPDADNFRDNARNEPYIPTTTATRGCAHGL